MIVYAVVSAVDCDVYEEPETTTFALMGIFSTALRAYRAIVHDICGPVTKAGREQGSLYLRNQDGHLYRLGREEVDVV